jgi:hypothetical protein
MLNFFKKKKPFVCGGNNCIEFVNHENGTSSFIYYRDPTGEEKLEYLHCLLEYDTHTLKALTDNEKLLNKLHSIALLQKYIPFAKKIITDVKGYVDHEGNELKNLDIIAKFFPNHLQNVTTLAFQINDSFKKKD